MTTSDDNNKTRLVSKDTPLDDRTQIAKQPEPPSNPPVPSGDNKTRIAMPPKVAPDDNQTRIAKPQGGSVDNKTRVWKKDAKPVVPDDATRYEPIARSEAVTERGTDPATNSPGPEPLSLLKNRFELGAVLGAGGMGVVYKAKDRLKVEAQDRNPFVAVKVLGAEFKEHPEAFISLQRESRKSQAIAHPNIVNVHDFDRDGDTVFMTMEFLDGHPLDELIAQYAGIGLPRDDVWKILQGICSALGHAHDENIIHSDFKPGNIFFTNKGVAKVFDFGIARAVSNVENLEDPGGNKTAFDAATLGALTPAYASLEMLEGETPDIRDDVYALGCIAYELFTGEHPFGHVNAKEAAEQNLKLKKIPGLKGRQWKAIERACAFRREDRIESAAQFWQLMTQKKSRVGMTAVFLIMLLAGAGGAYTQFFMEKEPEFKEDEVRNEIEYKLRIELQTKAINELLADTSFSEAWEAEIWREYQAARELLGQKDEWLNGIQTQLFEMYTLQIGNALDQDQSEAIASWIEHAKRYAGDLTVLAHFTERLDQLLANIEEERARQELARQQQEQARLAAAQQQKIQQQKVQVQAERRTAYATAIETVRDQLSCRANINMKDLGTAIKKLRDIDRKKYLKEEPSFVNQLSLCLEKIGKSYPERAKDSKKAAVRLFPGNKTIANISIIARDPCSQSIAGMGSKGARATCRDRIARVGQGPALVVIPASAKGKIFAIAKYETTVDEINIYCESSGKCEKRIESNLGLPATDLPLSLVRGYLRWLSDETKRQYRLPSQAEWLHAARAGRSSLDSNRNCTLQSRGIEKGGTLVKASVGKQNAWGLVNHIGNAQELASQKGGGLVALGGSHSTPMDSCNFSFQQKHNGKPDALTTIRVLREIDTSTKR